jgi:ATP-dependent DNA helicase RecQ
MDELRDLLQRHFGYQEFRDGQQRVMESLVAGHSAAAVFPTGGGKSLCYQLPALVLPGLTLVVSPLIALMKDQIDALTRRNIRAARLDSGQDANEVAETIRLLRAGELKLLYVSPERFKNERFRALLDQLPISLFAVDEAHCISEWGHNFRPDYLKLAGLAREIQVERVLALTATATPQVMKDICEEFGIAEQHAVRTTFHRANLQLRFQAVDPNDRDVLLVDLLRARPKGSTVVYVTLQKTAEAVARMLESEGMMAQPYHAGLDLDERTRVQDWFLKRQDAIIVATIAFGMGIDKPDIRYVYHYNVAKSLENYSQEIGRAGRDGEPAICETLACRDDLRTLENFVYGDTPSQSSVDSLLRDLFRRSSPMAISLYQLANEHDIRDLVLRTLLTYLELQGYLEAGTPYYNEYKLIPLVPIPKILKQFDSSRQTFLKSLFTVAKKAARWYRVDVDAVAATTQSDRQRVVRALDYLAERRLIELQTSGLMQTYTIRNRPSDLASLVQVLVDRMQEREHREVARLHQLVELIELTVCQSSALGSHFGEPLDQPCGHCHWCQAKQQVNLPMRFAPPVDRHHLHEQWNRFQRRYPQTLGSPRAMARFLCGLTSPRLVRDKLTRDPAFGSLSDHSFDDVLSALEQARARP